VGNEKGNNFATLLTQALSRSQDTSSGYT